MKLVCVCDQGEETEKSVERGKGHKLAGRGRSCHMIKKQESKKEARKKRKKDQRKNLLRLFVKRKGGEFK